MEKYIHIFLNGFKKSFERITYDIAHPFEGNNFFYWMVIISLLVWVLEIVWPWRKEQKPIRRDFWLDIFYMVFNMYLFGLIGYTAISDVFVKGFNNFLESYFGIENLIAINLMNLEPIWVQLLIYLVIKDFIQYFIHRLLHRVPFLWQVHKVHHSAKELGFAVQMRFHWGESVVYRFFEYLPMAMIGLRLDNYIIISVFAFILGHFNHANVPLKYGPFKYLLNNPRMHIWHHAKDLPQKRRYGVNFGLVFSIWDYLFGTVYTPKDGRDIELGFPDDKEYPRDFWGQMKYPFKKKNN